MDIDQNNVSSEWSVQKCNQIKALHIADGMQVSQKEIDDMAMDFYRELFRSQVELALELTNDMNEALDKPYSAQEVE